MITDSLPKGVFSTKRLPSYEREMESNYFAAARSRKLDEFKDGERQRVLRHVLDNFEVNERAVDTRLRVLTLPGSHWHFERMIEHELGEYKALFLGVERTWSTLEFGLQYMPGRRKRHVRWSRGTRNLNAVLTSKGAVFNCQVEDWPHLSSVIPDEESGIHQIKNLRILSTFNALWLDFFGPLMQPKIALLLRGLMGRIASTADVVPYAFTGMYGRDFRGLAGGSVEARSEGIAAEFSSDKWSATPTDCWKYIGLNGTPMVTVCGLLRRNKVA